MAWIYMVISSFVWFRSIEPIKPNIGLNKKLGLKFKLPVKHDISTSGTFGELRPNHFHAGLDIKSATGRSGEPVMAAAKGFVSRIKVSAYGYGNALYITHPNGHMTVYGHLDRYMPRIQEYVMKEHYRLQKFELDLHPTPNQFPVEASQIVAYLGNTGSSTGPHLHFEVRDASSEKALNPLDYGIDMKDEIAPKLYSIKLYNQSSGNSVPIFSVPVNESEDKKYSLGNDTVMVSTDVAGIAMRAYDLSNKSQLGVYGIRLYADDVLMYSFDMDELSFDEMRYSNAHRDYQEQSLSRQIYHRLFKLPGNKLPIYKDAVNDGWIYLERNTLKRIRIEVYDHAGNTSTLNFKLMQVDGMPSLLTPGSRFVSRDQRYQMEQDNLRLEIPADRLYEDIYLKYNTSAGDGTYSPIYQIHESSTPLHKSINLSIKPNELPDRLKRKAIIAHIGNRSITSYGGKWVNGRLETSVNTFGRFAVMVDTTSPTIKPIKFKPRHHVSALKYKIYDNFGTDGAADELKYNAWIDDRWVLMEYDAKSDMITHHLDGHTPKGKHTIKVQVTDDRGNSRIFAQSFIR